ncbi:MAG: sulfatase, partial [Planctomycetota bacterium]
AQFYRRKVPAVYEMPRDTGVPEIKPVATHNRAILDFCSWRGLLVLAGTRADATPDGNTFAAPDGVVSLWFGAVDDLWKLGKPVGRGGPWKDTPVRAGQPSDPYLMTNYDHKTLEISHDADTPVAFTAEVDFDHTGTWRVYDTLTVEPGETLRHTFPAAYAAHWLRLTADKACTATAWLTYE